MTVCVRCIIGLPESSTIGVTQEVDIGRMAPTSTGEDKGEREGEWAGYLVLLVMMDR